MPRPPTVPARLVIAVIALALVPASDAAAARPCKPVVNPYAGSRYEGTNLSRIFAARVSCGTARRVARGAHRRALGMTPTPSGIRTFMWRRWRVTGNLRGDHDRYLATKPGGGRVRWQF